MKLQSYFLVPDMTRFGYFLISISFVVWGLAFLVPFTGVSAGEMAQNIFAIYVFSYAVFFAGSLLIGKEALWELNKYIRGRFRSGSSEDAEATDVASPEP